MKRLRGKHRTGMTLVELLITLVILLMLMGTFLWMIIAVKSVYQSSVSHARSRQDLQTAFSRISQDMRDSRYDTFTDGTSNIVPAVSFLSACDANGVFVTDSSGAPVWQKYVIYYIPSGTTKLVRKEVYGTFTAPLSAASLAAYCDGTGNLVVPSLSRMTWTLDGTAKTCLLSLVTESTNYNGKTDRQSRDMTVFFRN